MVSTINATSTGVATTADNSAIIKVQSNGVTVTALAWCNFNGTSASPITPRSNFNVSSVTKSASGTYAINFTNALADTNYAFLGTGSGETSNVFIEGNSDATKTTTSLTVLAYKPSTGTFVDCTQVNVVVFGNS